MNRLAVFFSIRIVVVSVGLACSATAQSPASPPAPAESPSEAEARIVGPRIVPCSPLLAEMVFQMGLGDCVVAMPQFWTPPPGVQLPVVGARDHVNSEAITALKPDILLVQQNINDFAAIPNVRVHFFRIETLDDYEQALADVAKIVGEWSACRFRDSLDKTHQRVADRPAKKVLLGSFYNGTFGASGENTFHDGMIRAAGGVNVVAAGGYKGWGVKLNNEGIMKLAPDVIVCQIAPGGEEAAREFFAGLGGVPAVRDERIFFVTDMRWNVISMHTTQQTAALAEMIHGPSAGEPIVATTGGPDVLWPVVGLGVGAAVLLGGGVALAILGRKRRETKA